MSQEWRVDDKGNRIHSTAVVGQDVVLGHRNSVGPLSVVGGLGCSVILGDDNSVGVGVVIGSPPRECDGVCLVDASELRGVGETEFRDS